MAALFTTRWVEEFADRLMVTVYKVRHKAGRYVADIHTPSGSDLARDLLEVRLAVAL